MSSNRREKGIPAEAWRAISYECSMVVFIVKGLAVNVPSLTVKPYAGTPSLPVTTGKPYAGIPSLPVTKPNKIHTVNVT